MRHDSGQSIVEFILVTTFVALALILPWLDGQSPAELLLASLATLAATRVDWLKLI